VGGDSIVNAYLVDDDGGGGGGGGGEITIVDAGLSRLCSCANTDRL
jgi:hypothetical protein